MRNNKDERIIFRCTKEEKDCIIGASKKLNMSMYNYIINSTKSYEANKKSIVNVRDVAELGNLIKTLEYKYTIVSEDSNELKRRFIKLCQN